MLVQGSPLMRSTINVPLYRVPHRNCQVLHYQQVIIISYLVQVHEVVW